MHPVSASDMGCIAFRTWYSHWHSSTIAPSDTWYSHGMYHAALVLGLCLFYALLCYGFAAYFKAGPARLSWRSAALIAVVAIIGDAGSTLIPDWQLANRFLHVF